MAASTLERLSIRADMALGPVIEQDIVDHARRLVGLHLSRYFGGCTVHVAKGYWSAMGDDYVDEYPEPKEEVLFSVNLMVMPDQLEKARSCIQQCGVLLIEMGVAPNLHRVHCEVSGSQAHHITVDIPSPQSVALSHAQA